MLTSDDKVGGWVKKGQNHDDVILEWSLTVMGFAHTIKHHYSVLLPQKLTQNSRQKISFTTVFLTWKHQGKQNF